jgi:hypothetical protein
MYWPPVEGWLPAVCRVEAVFGVELGVTVVAVETITLPPAAITVGITIDGPITLPPIG